MTSLRTLLRTLLLLAFLLGTAAAQAQDWEFYGLRVCNKGDLSFSVAIVSKLPGTLSDDWSVYGWKPIKPNQCAQVYYQRAWESGFTIHHPAIHVAFAFTDSTGAWGPVKLAFPRESTYQFCGTREEFRYNHQPASSCVGSQFWIPASVDYDPAPRFSTNVWGASEALTLNVAMTAKDRVSVVVQGGSGGASASSNSWNTEPSKHPGNDNTALMAAAGLAGAVLVGAVIEQFIESAKCNTPVPKPFEKGTLNADIMRDPVVRRTCKTADWYDQFADGRTVTVAERFGISNQSVGSILDPPQQVDNKNTRTPDSAQAPEVRSIINSLDRILGSRGRTTVTTYGKFRYKADSDEVNEVWVNLVALDVSRATVAASARGLEDSRLSIPCVGERECALYLVRKANGGYIKGFSRVQLYLQGQGTWQEALSQLNNLKAMFPQAPVVRTQ